MKEYFLHTYYVIRHKLFVFRECIKMGIIWQGITHDLSKLSPAEFGPYSRMFYTGKKQIRSSMGYYKSYDTGNEEFELAWLSHIRKNKHHWQYWVLPHDRDDEGCEKIFDMPEKYALEMICDWIGAAKAQRNNHTALEWYNAHKHKLGLSAKTKIFIEKKLSQIYNMEKNEYNKQKKKVDEG
jgi:Family of unknown function (DUF5662)